MPITKFIRWFLRDDGKDAQRLRRLVKFTLLLALFVGLFWIVPIDQVFQALLEADPLQMTIGMVLGFLATVLTAVELEPLTRHQGIRHNIWSILEINLAVKFYSQFMPTTLVGSGLRWYRLAQPGDLLAESLAAMAFFRVLETFLTVTMGLGFWVIAGQEHMQANLTWLALIVAAIIAGWVLVTRKSIPMYHWFKAHSRGWLDRPLWKPIDRKVLKYLEAISAYASIPARDLVLAVFAGVASVMLGVLSGLFLAHAVGIEISFLELGWIQAIILVTTQLPFAVAGGLGIREVTLVALLSGFGVSSELALAYSFLLFLRGIVTSLPGGATEAIRTLRAGPSKNPGAPTPQKPPGPRF